MTPLEIPDLSEKFITRFWSKIQIKEADECWPWTASRVTSGYGSIGINGKLYGSHRLAVHIALGPFPKELLCCHKCDNRWCCNPSHIFLGSHTDNMRDMQKKGRANTPKGAGHHLSTNRKRVSGERWHLNRNPEKFLKGERHGCSKLTESKVREIRAECQKGERSYLKIGLDFGITPTHVFKIHNRLTWKHLE